MVVKHPQYPIPYAYQQQLDSKIDQMLKKKNSQLFQFKL